LDTIAHRIDLEPVAAVLFDYAGMGHVGVVIAVLLLPLVTP
jgi:hypothetical protein